MSPLSDEEVQRRLQAATQAIRDRAAAARAPRPPVRPMPKPVADEAPPPPHAEPEEDREP